MADVELLLTHARQESLKGQHGLALAYSEEALARAGDNPQVKAFHGLVCWKAGRHTAAITSLVAALEHYPGHPELSVALLDSYAQLGLPRKALQAAAAMSPDLLGNGTAAAAVHRARLALQQSNPDAAVAERLAGLHNAYQYEQVAEQVEMLLQEWPQWGLGHAFRASVMRQRPDAAVAGIDLAIAPGESVEAAGARWRATLHAAHETHRGEVLRAARQAVDLDAGNSLGGQILVRARFEAGEALDAQDHEVLRAIAPLGLLPVAPLRTVRDAGLAGSLTWREIEPPGIQQVAAPDVIGGGAFASARQLGSAALQGTYAAVAGNAQIVGRSDVVRLHDGSALCDSLTHPLGELTNWRMDNWIAIRSPEALLLKAPGTARHVAGPAVKLVGASTFEYGHWLMEHLPRLRALEQLPSFAGAAFIVDAGMPATHLQALALVLGREPVVIELQVGEPASADELLLSGPDCYFPYVPTTQGLQTPSLAPSSVAGMSYLRSRAVGHLPARTGPAPRRRIFVRRASELRQLLNEADLIERLAARWGFEAVQPETLSFAQQVQLFQDADFVAGAHGSALTNCLFCRPGTEVLTITAPFADNLPSWAGALGELGVRNTFAIARGVTGSHPMRRHWDLIADIGAVESFIEERLQATRDNPPR